MTAPVRSALFTVRVDGGGLKQLTPWGNGAGDADWSPSGKKLVFEANPNNKCRGDVYTVDSDGQHLKNSTDNRCDGGIADPSGPRTDTRSCSHRRASSAAASAWRR